jgi:hypothetical protein
MAVVPLSVISSRTRLREKAAQGKSCREQKKRAVLARFFLSVASVYFDFFKLMPIRATIEPAARSKDTGPKYSKNSIVTHTRY